MQGKFSASELHPQPLATNLVSLEALRGNKPVPRFGTGNEKPE